MYFAVRTKHKQPWKLERVCGDRRVRGFFEHRDLCREATRNELGSYGCPADHSLDAHRREADETRNTRSSSSSSWGSQLRTPEPRSHAWDERGVGRRVFAACGRYASTPGSRFRVLDCIDPSAGARVSCAKSTPSCERGGRQRARAASPSDRYTRPKDSSA